MDHKPVPDKGNPRTSSSSSSSLRRKVGVEDEDSQKGAPPPTKEDELADINGQLTLEHVRPVGKWSSGTTLAPPKSWKTRITDERMSPTGAFNAAVRHVPEGDGEPRIPGSAEARSHQPSFKDERRVFGSNASFFERPLSKTATTSGIVSDVSATFVATTTFTTG